MSWWTTASALTPVFAADALHLVGDGTRMQDQVDPANGLKVPDPAAGALLYSANGEAYFGIDWRKVRSGMVSGVPLPARGALLSLIRPMSSFVLSDADSYYMVAADFGGPYYFMGNAVSNAGLVSAGGSAFNHTYWHVCGGFWDDNTFTFYRNGGAYGQFNWTGRMTTLLGPQHNPGGENWAPAGQISTYGIFSGTPVLADLQAIEAQMRAEMLIPSSQITARGLPPGIGRQITNPFPPGYAAGARGLVRPAGRLNIYQNGKGVILGTVKEKTGPSSTAPLQRMVRVYNESSGLLVAQSWSDPVTGAYRVENLDTAYRYTVISYDHIHNYRAVIGDNIQPEVGI